MQKIYCDFINSDHIVLFLSTEIKLESFVHLFLFKMSHLHLLYRICHPNLKHVIFLVGIIMTRIFLPKSRENVTLTNSTLKLLVQLVKLNKLQLLLMLNWKICQQSQLLFYIRQLHLHQLKMVRHFDAVILPQNYYFVCHFQMT